MKPLWLEALEFAGAIFDVLALLAVGSILAFVPAWLGSVLFPRGRARGVVFTALLLGLAMACAARGLCLGISFSH